MKETLQLFTIILTSIMFILFFYFIATAPLPTIGGIVFKDKKVLCLVNYYKRHGVVTYKEKDSYTCTKKELEPFSNRTILNSGDTLYYN